jgi:hypothetical protein
MRVPSKTPSIVYEDASDTFPVEHGWPRCAAWTAAGLDFRPDDPTPRSIADRVEVVAVG